MACTPNSCGTVKWAAQQFGIKSYCDVVDAPSGQAYTYTADHVIKGVQSVGFDSNFELTPIFQLSQGEIYETNEGLPQVDISVNKVLDGYTPVYLAATQDSVSPTLFGRAPVKCVPAIAIFPCTVDSATGAPNATVVFPQAQVNSVSYTFGNDGPFTEDVSFIANNVLWSNPAGHPGHDANCPGGGCELSAQFLADIASISFSGFNTTNSESPNPKVQFREDLIFGYDELAPLDLNCMVADPDATVLPPEVYGITASGVNDDDICVNNITISVDLSREEIFCLGTRGPRNRTITTPVTVSTSIEVNSETGDNVSATDYGICEYPAYSGTLCSNLGINLPNRTIRVATCDGLRVYTGIRNKLVSSSQSGGGTDGSNLTVTYNFQTFNTFTVLHENDVHPSGATWWANRDTWLTDV